MDGESHGRIVVDIRGQWLRLEKNDGSLLRLYPVSTAKNGTGTLPGSNKTPTGRFRIAQKIGGDCRPETIFRGRIPCGFWPEEGKTGDNDVIMSRILRLEGLDPDNANTWDRYIYIHGTNRQDLLGIPASHGCIRMAPEHIIDLFNMVPEGMVMVIS